MTGRSAEGEGIVYDDAAEGLVEGKIRRGGSEGTWGRELLIFLGDGVLEADPRRGGNGGGVTDEADVCCRDGAILWGNPVVRGDDDGEGDGERRRDGGGASSRLTYSRWLFSV